MNIGQEVALVSTPYMNPALKIVHKGKVVALRDDFGGLHAKILWERQDTAQDLWINTLFLVDPVTLRPQNAGHGDQDRA